MFSVQGKVVVITGGASGIGEAVAKRLSQAGATCAVLDLADAGALASEINGSSYVVDVTDADAMTRALATIGEAHGQVDVMVNNAGIIGVGAGLMSDDPEAGQRVLDINLLGVVHGVRAAVPHMSAGGSIINTASMAGLVGFPGLAWYGASKSAVVGLTQQLAVELGGRGIRVNCVCPTGVDTPMASDPDLEHWASATQALANQHVRRFATADEVAAAVHYLASDDAAMINGHALAVDGGLAAGLSTQLIEAALGRPIRDENGFIE